MAKHIAHFRKSAETSPAEPQGELQVPSFDDAPSPAQHSQDLLQKLSEQVPGVIYQFRLFPDGRSCFPYASKAIRFIYEVTPEQVREDASAVFALLHPEDYAGVVASIQESASKLTPWQYEYRVILPRQGMRWRRGDARPERLDDGSVLWHGFITDITDRKQIGTVLRQNEERLRQAVRVSKIGIVDHDHLTDSIYWSPEQRDIYQWGPKEPVSLAAYLKHVHPDDVAAIAMAVKRAHDPTGDGLFDVEHRIVRRDGAIRWLTTRSQTIFSGEGAARRPLRTIGAVLDVIERKQTDDLIVRLNKLYATLSETNQTIVRVRSEAELFAQITRKPSNSAV